MLEGMKRTALAALLPAFALTACQFDTSTGHEPTAEAPSAAAAPSDTAPSVASSGLAPVRPGLAAAISVSGSHFPTPTPALRCAATAPFTSVSPVLGVASGAVNSVALTADELELFATVPTPGASTSSVVRMVRASTSDPFLAAPEPNVTSATGFLSGVGLSRDGLALYVSASVPNATPHAPAGMQLQVARRASLADRFSAPVSAGLDAPFPWHVTQMTPSPSGASLFGSVSVAGTWRIQEIVLAAPVLALSGANDVLAPSPMASGVVPTADGRYAYVGQGSWVGNSALLFSVALAEKAPGATKYGAPAVLGAPLNEGGNGGVPQWLSTDECSLYTLGVSPGGTFQQLSVARK
jgi:hypothetical protein